MNPAFPLYQRWREVATANAAHWALQEGGRTWTFAELQSEVDRRPPVNEVKRCAPVQGRTAEFVLTTLQAWRDGLALIPIEDGASLQPDTLTQLECDLPADIAHIKTTSGSTGTPRHILFTAEQLAADAHQIVSTMGLRRDHPNIGVISMAHSYGFSNLVLPLLLHGIPLVLAPDPLPETMRRTLASLPSKTNGVTIPAVPVMWRTWLAAELLDAETVRLAISAGAPLPVELERSTFDATGVKVHNFLGASECGGIAYDRTRSPRDIGSQWIGNALDGVSLSLNAEGVLTATSAAVGSTYWPRPEPALANGVFSTGDHATLAGEHNSEVYLSGRVDDLINVSGRKVQPAEIEQLLLQAPGVQHAVVFGIPSNHATRGEQIAAVMSFHPSVSNPDAAIQSIRQSMNQTLADAPWKLPRHWRHDQLLKPDVRGKISRVIWRRRFIRSEKGLGDEP